MRTPNSGFTLIGHNIAVAGFMLFSIAAPHSIAAAEIGLGVATAGWLVRLISSRSTGLCYSRCDLPICLFFIWTVASAFLSEEPKISLLKLQSVCVLFIFYLTRAVITRRTAASLVMLMIVSACVGSIWSAIDLMRGRGVIIQSISNDSPFRATPLGPGDALWKVGDSRVYSVKEIDDVIRDVGTGIPLSIGVISRGEHVIWPGLLVTEEMKSSPSPSGLSGTDRMHRFRASGWTRHYEAFAEILQILTQLALGLAVVNLKQNGSGWTSRVLILATVLCATGVVLTAMRSVAVAMAFGACVVAWRTASGRARAWIIGAMLSITALGSIVVWETRSRGALAFGDSSSSLRWTVAKIGLSRILIHPFFGHGMDSMHKHWSEWGFPGTDMIHMHSTPLQIAFDRGIPALLFWLWFAALLWAMVLKAERATRRTTDVNRHGLFLGATGAIAGFLASSMVNYNLGTGIVALVFWWLAGISSNLAHNAPHASDSPSPSL